MPPLGNQFRPVRDLVNRDEADTESTSRTLFSPFIAARDVPKSMEITPVVMDSIRFPLTVRSFDICAFAEYPIIVDHQGVVFDVECDRCGRFCVISVLNQLVSESPESLQVAKLCAYVSQVIQTARQCSRLRH